ncbi:hypothetical protein EDC01DRAFT_293905 [Geopyxis carbonaria]|nr:hypothetical protein EDC01DRAFT_293905 [Geopyxis carbonaria]
MFQYLVDNLCHHFSIGQEIILVRMHLHSYAHRRVLGFYYCYPHKFDMILYGVDIINNRTPDVDEKARQGVRYMYLRSCVRLGSFPSEILVCSIDWSLDPVSLQRSYHQRPGVPDTGKRSLPEKTAVSDATSNAVHFGSCNKCFHTCLVQKDTLCDVLVHVCTGTYNLPIVLHFVPSWRSRTPSLLFPTAVLQLLGISSARCGFCGTN